jgi:hypothetical protein
MVAGVWDDLYPGTSGGAACLYYYSDAANHRYVVEWFRVPHISYPATEENFEILLYDPAYYPTPTGDGEIIVQYKNAMKETDNTCGIENSAQTVGIQYFLEGAYHSLGVPITDTFALKYTPIAPTVGVSEQTKLGDLLIRRSLVVYPSVTRGRLQIAYNAGLSAEGVGLKVYDITGRLVRDLSSLVTLPSSLVTWKGDDDLGRKVASGVYFVKLSADGKETVEKAVLLR